MNEDKGCVGGVLLAFLAGGLIGAGLALLYAPAAGRETRQKIEDLAEDVKKRSETWGGDLRKKAEGWSSDLRGKVSTFLEEEKAIVKAAYDAGREAVEKERAKFASTE